MILTGYHSTLMASPGMTDSATLQTKQKLQEHIAMNIGFPKFIQNTEGSIDVKIRFRLDDKKIEILEADGDDDSVKQYVVEELSMMSIPAHLKTNDTYKVILRFRVA